MFPGRILHGALRAAPTRSKEETKRMAVGKTYGTPLRRKAVFTRTRMLM